MAIQSEQALSPVLYLPHGGGPLPLLGDRQHAKLTAFLKTIHSELGQPKAILVISAHWEANSATLTSASQPELIYDYYGFPPESYEIQYPVPGEPALAKDIYQLLRDSGIEARLDPQRGFDHGLFVPLKLIYPEADIPCVQLSLLGSLDPAAHIALGKALTALRGENVVIIGSGLSFHNLRAFFGHSNSKLHEDVQFDQWLVETCTSESLSTEQRATRLIQWEQAPFARYCHPREEHLLPLHVCFGAAMSDTPVAKQVFNERLMGKRVSGFLWR
jgi:aromatic ring-opening dioxygenase catalytic subunit (LigB family)